MNAKEYRAYREEQEYLKEKNRKITPVSAVYTAPCTITLNDDKANSKGIIRATLNGYSKLNAEIEEIVAREQVLRVEIAKIIAELEG